MNSAGSASRRTKRFGRWPRSRTCACLMCAATGRAPKQRGRAPSNCWRKSARSAMSANKYSHSKQERQMKAVRVIPGAEGGRVEIQDIAAPEAGAGQVLVRVRATGLNRGEINQARDLRAGPTITAGVEFAGEV